MSLKFTRTGDWARAGATLKMLSTGSIVPAFSAQMREDGELILEKLLEHIELQDLNWTPLSETTIAQKGHDTIYVETGFLRDNLKVRKVRAPKNGLTYFIGADAWTIHKPSGLKFSDLMIYLEYGTEKIPARPLIRPTMQEVEKTIQRHWRECLRDLITKGG